MAFHAYSRWGDSIDEPSVEQMEQLLDQLDADDDEHQSVSITHESEWCLGAYPGGLLVWENLESGDPRHMTDVPRNRVLELWVALSQGRLDEIERQPWLAGYGS
jgi:hypothetical protein